MRGVFGETLDLSCCLCIVKNTFSCLVCSCIHLSFPSVHLFVHSLTDLLGRILTINILFITLSHQLFIYLQKQDIYPLISQPIIHFSSYTIISLLKDPSNCSSIMYKLSFIHPLIHLPIFHASAHQSTNFSINVFINSFQPTFCIYSSIHQSIWPSIPPTNHLSSIHPLLKPIYSSIMYAAIHPSVHL